jgi:ATP/maltotriose-dependent transcriptional regulator MalT
VSAPDDLDRARVSYGRREWAAAFELLSAADSARDLSADDLELLANSAYLRGRYEVGLDALARAYAVHVDAGAYARAAACAYWSSFASINRGDLAQAQGWVTRAMTLLDDHGLDCVERGYLDMLGSVQLMMRGDHQAALLQIEGVLAVARRFDDVNLRALASLGKGQGLIADGVNAAGMALLDEVMVAATSGELTETIAGLAYCAVLATCQDAFDVERAREWTVALSRFCADQPDLVPYSGQCLVHRAEIHRLEGDWIAAADAVEAAHARYELANDWSSDGMAFYEEAELLRLRGHLDAAERSYQEASRHGHDPQPGLALLRVAQGKAETAVPTSRRFVGETTNRLHRARLLAAHIEILLAAGETGDATSASLELDDIAGAVGAPMLHAIADRACGGALLAAGDDTGALARLRSAAEVWRDLDARYELARTRELVGAALERLGDADGADLERRAAATVYEELGAEPDLRRVRGTEPGHGRNADTPLTDREIEVLRLVASGMTNRAVAAELVLSEKTVARHVSNIFVKLGLSSRAAATAYAYEHRLV